jgi:hypothetical protein
MPFGAGVGPNAARPLAQVQDPKKAIPDVGMNWMYVERADWSP